MNFTKWLNEILSEINEQPVAWNFNLNEPFSVIIVGTKSFDKKDDDWACDEIYSSIHKHPEFTFSATSWEKALNKTILNIENYLKNGLYKDKLLESYAVGCGFVGGDLKLIYENPNKKFKKKKKKITLDVINDLPLSKLCFWLVVYAGYDEIDKTSFGKNFLDYFNDKKKPSEKVLLGMRNMLFTNMSKKNIKL